MNKGEFISYMANQHGISKVEAREGRNPNTSTPLKIPSYIHNLGLAWGEN